MSHSYLSVTYRLQYIIMMPWEQHNDNAVTLNVELYMDGKHAKHLVQQYLAGLHDTCWGTP